MSLQRNVDIIRTLTLAVLLCAISTTAYAALDAPHDDTNAIGCLSCHNMTEASPHLLPMVGAPVDQDDTLRNNVCWTCHTDPNSPPLFMDPHSSLTTSTNHGNWSVECWVCHNQHTQDQPSGNFIRKNINLAWIINPLVPGDKTGVKTVTYTGVGDHADGAGNGLCEICHTETAYYRNDGTGGTHNVGTDCLTCHAHDAGFIGGADHSTFIADDNQTGDATVKCSGCHANYASSPETAHSDCTVCHATPPTLIDSTFPNGTAPDYDGPSMFANLTTSGYTNINPLLDANGNDITDTVTPFISVKCGFCHIAKPDALANGDHGGHVATDFAWDAATQATCGTASCHDSATKTNVVVDIHNNATCTICHSTAQGGSGTAKVGDPLNGIDGNALLGAALPNYKIATCATCHNIADAQVNAATLGGIHHDNKTDGYPVVEANCTAKCHNVATYEGNHGIDVADTTNCNTCHTGTAGSVATGGVPINVGDPKVHDGCTSCHLIAPQAAADGQLRAVTAPGGSGNIAAGNCNTCHDAYFYSHTNANHTALTSVSPCLSCHTGDIIDGQTAVEANQGTHESNCADCHNPTTGARVDGSANAASYMGTAVNVGDATVNGGTGGTCADCHSPYFGSAAGGHRHTHTFTTSTGCVDCHGSGVAGTEAKEAITTPFVGASEVHGALACGTCHDLAGGTPTGALIGSAIGNSGATECVDCHIGGADTWTTVHTAAIGTGAGTVDHALSNGTAVRVDSSTNCSGCHANVAGSDARDAILSPYYGAAEVHETAACATCHTGNNDGGFKADGVLTKANTIVAGDCEGCHGSNGFDTIHTPSAVVDHANRVDEAASCAVCHTATGWDGVSAQPFSIPVDPTATGTDRAADMVHDSCLVCHTAANGKTMQTPGPYATTIVPGDCQTCHTGYNFDSHVHGTDDVAAYIQHNVAYVAGTDISQVSNPAPCANCHVPASGLTTWTGIVEEHDNTIVTCARCHNYVGNSDGQETPPEGDVDGSIGARAAATCTTCHTPKLSPAATSDHGGHKTTDFDSTGTSCVNCHDDGGLGTVEGIHGNTCTTCHLTNSGGMGTTIVGVNGWGSAQLSAQPPLADYRTGTCLTCHGSTYAYDTTFTNHAVKDHKTKALADVLTPATPATCTVNCHDGSSLANILTNTHGNGTTTTCTNCHTNITNDGSLRVGANSNGDASTHVIDTPSACSDCHSTYAADFTIHDVKDHTGVAGAATCTTTCHDGTSAAAIITNTHYNTCTNCHTNTTTDGKLIAGTNGDATNGSGTCTACHGGAFAYDTAFGTAHDVGDHQTRVLADVLTATASCATNCHDASTLGTIVTTLHTACTICHTNTAANGTLRSGGNGDATTHVFNTPSECATCHSGYATDYQAAHNVGDHTGIAGIASCTTTCHTATTPATIVTTTHKGTCTNCHLNNNTDGRLVSGANGDATGGTGDCAKCHTAHDINFTTGHAVKDHSGLATTAVPDTPIQSDDCNDCHTGLIVDVTLADEHNSNCLDCHSNATSDGTLLNGTNIGSIFDATSVGDASGHSITAPSECITCHTVGYFVNHTYDPNHTVQIGTDTSNGQTCSTAGCHDGQSENWTNIKTRHNLNNGAASVCFVCHDSTRTTNVVTGRTSVQDVILNETRPVTCLDCHSDRSAGHGGHDDTHFPDYAVGNNCTTTCHVVPAEGVVVGIHSNNCILCHDNAGGGTGTTIVAYDGDATRGVGAAPHTGITCLTCHDPATAGSGMTAASTGGIHHDKADAAFGSNCATCHGTGTTGSLSNGHDTRVATDSNCVTCHTGTVGTATSVPTVPADNKIHDYCTNCHTIAAPGFAAIRATPAAGRGLPGTQLPVNGGSCSTCHSVTPFKDYHHSTPVAQGGDCTVCHDQTLTLAGAPDQMACRECHVNVNGENGIVITSYRLSRRDGTDATTDFINTTGDRPAAEITAAGIVTSHTIASGAGIAVVDYKVCMDCHSRGNTTVSTGYRAAPVVAPFHGFPGDASTGSLVAADSANFKTMIGGGTYTIDENGTTQWPLVYQYGHPGHKTFRRMGGETQFMTRRSTRNGLTDNERLYDGNPWGPQAGALGEEVFRNGNMTFNVDLCQYTGDCNADYGINLETPVAGFAARIDIPYTQFGTKHGSGGGTTLQVPYFTNVVTPPALPDNVYVNSAEVDTNGDLQVSAGNTDGCTALTVWSNGTTNLGTMSGTSPNCTFTSVGITPVPTTIDVRTSNALGNNITGFPVTDNSVQPGSFTYVGAPYTALESAGAVTITVTRDGGSGAVTVDYATSDGTAVAGTDYTAASGTLSWADGATGSKTFTITVLDNITPGQGDRTVNITLSAATGGATIGAGNPTTLTIQEDDQPGTFDYASATYSVIENAGSINLVVTRTAGTIGAVTVDYARTGGTAPATDYTIGGTGTLSWAAGDATDKTIPVTINDNAVVDGDRTVILNISNPTGSAVLGTITSTTLTIVDNDNAPPAFGSPTYTAANATENVAYSSTVHMPAVDPEGDAITYSRNGGTCSTWATVNAAGTIAGTPLLADVGTCTVIVQATATGGSDTTTVTITVVAAPSCTPADVWYHADSDTATNTYGGMTVTDDGCALEANGIPGVGILVDNTATWPGTYNCADQQLNYSGSGVQATWIFTSTLAADTPIVGVTLYGYLRDRDGADGNVSFRLGYVTGGSFTSLGSVTQMVLNGERRTFTIDITGISGTAPAGSVVALQMTNDSGQADRAYLGTADDPDGGIRMIINECK